MPVTRNADGAPPSATTCERPSAPVPVTMRLHPSDAGVAVGAPIATGAGRDGASASGRSITAA